MTVPKNAEDSDDEQKQSPPGECSLKITSENEFKKLVESANQLKMEEDLKVLLNKKPKPRNFIKDLLFRQESHNGRRNTPSSLVNKVYNSYAAQSLFMQEEREFHIRPINSVKFNHSGELFVSSSDDKDITIWSMEEKTPRVAFEVAHNNCVLNAQFLPQSNGHIVTCGRDGRVYLTQLDSGIVKSTNLLIKQILPITALSTCVSTPSVVTSCGLDSLVYNLDIRSKPSFMFSCESNNGSLVRLKTISQDPRSNNYLCVAGSDPYIRIYERRMNKCFSQYKPSTLTNYKVADVCSAVYSGCGGSVLSSYCSDGIYLFSTADASFAEEDHKYFGHRNSCTSRDVSFFGSGNNNIISGSDCGNIFIWDRESEAIINCIEAGEPPGITGLAAHPSRPSLVTGGFDGVVKLWTSLQGEPASPDEIREKVSKNLHELRKSPSKLAWDSSVANTATEFLDCTPPDFLEFPENDLTVPRSIIQPRREPLPTQMAGCPIQ